MTQDFTADCFASGHVAQVDAQNIEDNFTTLRSSSSGGSAPSNPVAFMLWGDTSSGDECLKRRNDANDAWLGILCGDASHKMWVYRNDTCEGWVIDATVTDRVIALKGGSDAYNVNGGVNAGTWTQPGHVLAASEIPAHSHHQRVHDNYLAYIGSGSGRRASSLNSSDGTTPLNTADNTGGGNSHNHGDTYRPAAAVGTLQYPDL